MVGELRLLLEVVVGPRTQGSGTKFVQGARRGGWPQGLLAFVVEQRGWELDVMVLGLVFAVLIHLTRTHRRGRPKAPQVVPDSRLGNGQVVKQRAPGAVWSR